MSQRFSMFNAGYSAAAPNYYFRQLAFIDQYKNESAFARPLENLSSFLKKQDPKYSEYILTATSLAKNFNIPVMSAPNSYDTYFEWQNQYIEAFEKKFPMNRIDFYYFFYGRKISEIQSNICLAKDYVEINPELGGAIDLNKKIDDCLKDSQYIIFKLIAAAALLSSEPRLNFFNVLYRQVSSEFEQFKSIDLSSLDKDEFKNLSPKLENYRVMITDGYKKCCTLLEEMGI